MRNLGLTIHAQALFCMQSFFYNFAYSRFQDVNVQLKIQALTKLGNYLNDFIEGKHNTCDEVLFEKFYNKTIQAVHTAESKNKWFTKNNVYHALNYWSNQLSSDTLHSWMNGYEHAEHINAKKIGVIMAGNIPMVGLHDLLCVYLSGHHFYGKLSGDDQILIPHLIEILSDIDTQAVAQISFSEQFLKNMDAYIGTGSQNSTRYFDYYFRNKPSIIRGNRNGAAVLTGGETAQDFEKLGQDIFTYFGLGCRSVSKLFVPEAYQFDAFFEGIYSFHEQVNHHKYANNYDYNRTVYLMGNEKLLDNNFLLLKEDKGFSSPIAVLFYEYYQDLESFNQYLQESREKLQCIVSTNSQIKEAISFGTTQQPALHEYADGVDTMRFLLDLNECK